MSEMHPTEAEYLFNIYSTNLRLHVPDLKDAFACPLCLRVFSRDAIPCHHITIEHIIPSKAGGRLKTLTCGRCNHETGSKLDSHLVQRLKVLDPTFPVPFEWSVQENQVRGEAHREPDGSWIGEAIPKMCDPEALERVQQALDEGVARIRFRIDLGYNTRRSRMALLRSAYLLMFTYFGYSYILHETCKEIRRQIENPLADTPLAYSASWPHSPLAKGSTISIIKDPEDLRSFYVPLRLSRQGNEHYTGVVLPGFGEHPFLAYDTLKGLRGDKTDIRYMVIPYNPVRLSDPSCKWFLQKLWRELFPRDA